jgi:hypothetical protein
MIILLGIAAVITASAAFVLACYVGRACLTWSRRCHPMNPSFKPPHLPGARSKD